MYSPQERAGLEQSMLALQQGRFEEARKQLKALRNRFPHNVEALHLLGLIAYQTGDAQAGLAQIQRAVELMPQAPHMRNNLANLLMAAQRLDEALPHYLEAIRLSPDHAEAWQNLGNIYRIKGDLPQALKAYQQAARLLPEHAGVLSSLGALYAVLGHPAQAESTLRQALALDANLVEAWFVLGELCLNQQRLDEAWSFFQNVLRRLPEHAPSYNSLGNILFLRGQLEQAEVQYRKALALKPEFAEAASNMGFICYRREAFGEAENWLRQALRVKPDYAQAWENLASVYRKLEDMSAAETAYLRAAEFGARPELEVKSAVMLPGIYDSAAEMQAWRHRLETGLEALMQKNIRLHDPSVEVGETSFYLHYHREPWLELAQKLAAFYRRVCPELTLTAPHCLAAPKSSGEVLRIGIVSNNLKRHSLGKMFGAVIGGLDRRRFNVTICADGPPADADARRLAEQADDYLCLAADFYAARGQLAEQRFDVLFYPELVTDPRIYFFAFARLAPLQATFWGMGSSTGLAEIDVYFSSTGLETDASRSFYSEKLIETAHLLPCFARPDDAGPAHSRSDWGLPETGPIYGCLQSLFKLHPDFDLALSQLLTADAEATLVLLEGHYPAWTDKLKARLMRTLGEAYRRVRFYPRLNPEDFLRLAGQCDVLLDPWPICGGNSTYELLATGVPLVTLTGPYGKNRLTHAILDQIGLTETVTQTPEAYIALAHRLAHDAAERTRLREHILSRLDRLYGRTEGLAEFDAALYAAYFDQSLQYQARNSSG